MANLRCSISGSIQADLLLPKVLIRSRAKSILNALSVSRVPLFLRGTNNQRLDLLAGCIANRRGERRSVARATRSAGPVERLSRVICPKGSLLLRMSSPLCKNILLRHLVETDLLIPPSRPTRGAYRDRHGRRARDAMDAAAFCARGDRRAGSHRSVSDHRAR